MSIWVEFCGPNAAYLADLYERYRADAAAVAPEIRALFERWGPPPLDGAAAPAPARAPAASTALVAGAIGLVTAIRAYGHRAARLDPLGSEPPGDSDLLAETHGIREQDLAALPAAIVGGPLAERAANAYEAVQALRRIYQGTSGYEFEHVSNDEERNWLRWAVEAERFRPPHDPINERQLLERLTEVGAFERFLHRAFPSQTRFSLEGLGMLIPMLDEIIGAAAEEGTRGVVLGMAHRGRLNVLAHVLGKPYAQIIGEFMEHYQRSGVSPSGSSDEGWTGDVKYHLGARRAIRGGREVDMLVTLVPNPSHLEFVNPVVEGVTRAYGGQRDRPGPPVQDERANLAVLIHGDAAFPGQGIVAETLNLSRLPGYRTGGTIHIIANNQLGFTTPPQLGRSTLYASDLAKGFEMPIIHVNADDPVAVLAAARLAHAYRERFHKDVLIDLIGYRRWGHNEGDDPTFTQPRMYAAIAQHPTIREICVREMVQRGLLTQEEADAMLQEAIERLHAIRRTLLQRGLDKTAEAPPAAGLEAGGLGLGSGKEAATVETAVPVETLAQLNEQLVTLPPGFHLHPRLERFVERRRAVFASGADEAPAIDWAHAEALAFATILAEGTPIRLTGQDTARGTFSQRHLVLHDVETGATYTPLQALPAARASFEVWDSPLSEQAALGFEFGYSVAAPDTLVLWEAQYGDFVNAAQVIVDQFIASAKAKWEQQPALVLLLPHGYEGQGPEHSSARLERFLQLAAEDNLRVANCTTAAQYFHILRRQARLLAGDRRPLVLLTPKSLLRHPLASSPVDDLAGGRFQPVLDDPIARQEPRAVRRLILCSGKIYVDLVTTGKLTDPDVVARSGLAVVRLEELYPFPVAELARVVAAYPRLEEIVWLQEEPRNMGAWTYVETHIFDLFRQQFPLRYIGRPWRASPAEGSRDYHAKEQARLLAAALTLDQTVTEETLAREVRHGS